VLAVTLGDSAVLTGERLLAQAVRQHHLAAVDLFDVVRVALREGRIVRTRAREICIEWDRDRFSAGRPMDYTGNFDQELALREERSPLPF
jgi:hypothetical protein